MRATLGANSEANSSGIQLSSRSEAPLPSPDDTGPGDAEQQPTHVLSQNYWLADEDDSSDELSTEKTSSNRSSSSRTKLLDGIRNTFGRSHSSKVKIHSFYKDGILVSNARERDRNVLQHRAIADIWDGRLCLSPVAKPAKVLDVGTGNGLWALEFGKEHPECHVTGVDIESINPLYTLPNCSFEVMDVTQPWTIDTTFDFIHVRMLGAFSRHVKETAFLFMWHHLNPGGYIEFTEWGMRLYSPDHSADKTRFDEWLRVYVKGMKKLGFSSDFIGEWKQFIREAGCSDITQRKYPIPLNTWPPSKRLKKIGNIMSTNAETWIDSISAPVLGTGLNWPEEDIDKLVSDCHKEIPDPNYHSFMRLMTIYARKLPDKRSSPLSYPQKGSGQVSDLSLTL